ncbi:MAG: phosphate acyltransferase PlsX [Hyphomicrobiaceae bacterium]
MASPLVIALDAMGGDHGPDVVVPGAELSLIRHPEISFCFFGDEVRIRPLVEARPALKARAEIVHTDVVVGMDEKPSQALKRGRHGSSMWLAVNAVKSGDATVAVSGGNTGALMAMSKLALKTHPGIERPVISAIWPTVDAECIVLDVGANVGATAEQLVSSALLGAAMARALFDIEKPSVGLLNIGVEEVKGLDEIKRAHAWLRDAAPPFTYKGFVEGDQIGHGIVDVVVTDGFTGNIALKTAEGTAKQIGQYLRQAMTRSLLSKLGAYLAQGAFTVLKRKMDPRRLNGGVFLGLNGLVIKSHGGTDAMGFASAIDLGYDIARAGLMERIGNDLKGFDRSSLSSLAS